MKAASSQFIEEERRRFGAIPRLKAEIRPFDVDFGLAPGAGTAIGCYCPNSGILTLGGEGDPYTASWTSEILQAYLGQLSAVIPSCISLADYNSSSFYVRSAARYDDVSREAWVEVDWGATAVLGAYFQIKIEFSGWIRAWAVDEVGDMDGYTAYATDGGMDSYLSYAVGGVFPGQLRNITLAGLVEIGEGLIVDCQNIISARPKFFHDIHGENHVLTVDNRGRQWIPGHQNFLMADGLWYGKELHLYTGFELPTGEVSWVRQYVGRIRDIREIGNSFTGKHQAKIFSSLLIHEVLSQIVGAPGADGTRNPYIAGYYKARADLMESIDPSVGTVTKTGTGSADLVVLGTPTNTEDESFLIEAESTGEISAATFRWSIDGGASWEKAGVVSVSSINPFRLRSGLFVYFVPGAGSDLVAGDRFSFTSYARRTRYRVPGAPFEAMTHVYFNGVEVYIATPDLSTGEIELAGPSGLVDARVVKSETSNPVDIISELLEEVGLTDKIDQVSFSNAKQLIADYQIGVRFEGVPVWKAIQEICRACLIFFWVDADTIYVSAYTGEA